MQFHRAFTDSFTSRTALREVVKRIVMATVAIFVYLTLGALALYTLMTRQITPTPQQPGSVPNPLVTPNTGPTTEPEPVVPPVPAETQIFNAIEQWMKDSDRTTYFLLYQHGDQKIVLAAESNNSDSKKLLEQFKEQVIVKMEKSTEATQWQVKRLTVRKMDDGEFYARWEGPDPKNMSSFESHYAKTEAELNEKLTKLTGHTFTVNWVNKP